MANYYKRYQQGLCQEVYDELVALPEQVFDESIYQDAAAVGRVMMSRVRSNIAMVVVRLKIMGYHFVDGFWDKENYGPLSQEEEVRLDQCYPIFAEPPAETPALLNALEQRIGMLPISLKCWYQQIGSVNLIGTFPATNEREQLSDILDPLLIYSLKEITEYFSADISSEGIDEMPLAPDGALKYGYSGSGSYSVNLSYKAFDTQIDLYQSSQITFINYLRTCFRWGGFFGLEAASRKPAHKRLTPQELHFLTEGLLAF